MAQRRDDIVKSAQQVVVMMMSIKFKYLPLDDI